MLLREGDARTDVIDRRLASILAGVAGALNAAAFHAVGFFSANMTGNVSALSDHFALRDWAVGGFYLFIVVAFVIGAMTSSCLIHAGRRRNVKSIYAVTILIESALLAILGVAVLHLPLWVTGWVLIMGLSFLMGLQNALVTTISGARIRTTHVSGMVTDIGIELSTLMMRNRQLHRSAESTLSRRRLRLHAQTVMSFLLGGVIGVVIYGYIGLHLLFCAAAVLLVMSTAGIVRSAFSLAA